MLVVGCVMYLLACTPKIANPAPTTELNIFEGTPLEFVVLVRGCLEDRGIVTEDDPGGNKTVYLSDNTGMDADAAMAVQEECYAQIGLPKMAGLSDVELRDRYQARVDEWECLADNGLVSGDAPAFDVFVDKYQRTGQKELWEPTFEVAPEVVAGMAVGPSDLCPKSGEVW